MANVPEGDLILSALDSSVITKNKTAEAEPNEINAGAHSRPRFIRHVYYGAVFWRGDKILESIYEVQSQLQFY